MALIALGLATAVAAATGLAYGWTSRELVIAELIVIGVCGALTKFVEPGMDRWDRGATGEERVGEALAQLEPEGWRALHDVSFGRGNIDHIVIGPGGLFTIETKSQPGRVRADAVDPAWLSQAYAESKVLERIVNRPVVPLLVFSRAYVERARTRKGVVVLSVRALAGHLKRRKVELGPDEVDVIYRRLLHACSQMQL